VIIFILVYQHQVLLLERVSWVVMRIMVRMRDSVMRIRIIRLLIRLRLLVRGYAISQNLDNSVY
jgi:hypothetical protein